MSALDDPPYHLHVMPSAQTPPPWSSRQERLRLAEVICALCAGTPLRPWELFLAAIRGTTTKAGLTVEAVLHSDKYQTGFTVTNALMRTLNLQPHAICPAWSYTLRPRQPACL
jgi:hypothetical protein